MHQEGQAFLVSLISFYSLEALRLWQRLAVLLLWL